MEWCSSSREWGREWAESRLSEGPPKGLKTDEQTSARSSNLCVLLTYWFKPLYEHRVQ
jgi:hypothetical protein